MSIALSRLPSHACVGKSTNPLIRAVGLQSLTITKKKPVNGPCLKPVVCGGKLEVSHNKEDRYGVFVR